MTSSAQPVSSDFLQPVRDALARLPADTPYLEAVRQAAAETPVFLPLTPLPDIGAIAARMVEWRRIPGNPLEPLLQILEDLDIASPACLMAAVLAAMPSTQPFHNHHHTREVVFLSALLGLRAGLPPESASELFIAACIHDFVHDGLGNNRNGRHTPMRLETKALEAAKPFLNLPDAQWARIVAMVLATDVSKSNGPSPAQWMRMIYENKPADDCPAALRPLRTDRTLALQAALLEDADIGTSAGMPYDIAKKMTALVAQETGVFDATPQTLLGFLNDVCHGRFITQAAQDMFGHSINDLRREASAEAPGTTY